ncbi:MAG TPA: dockerin type I repeat-containing protein, partial [Tepidisphaeraceae bacterium]|nr:dockerin type I repeat-containing protein [Tepidisphaeraceae bacterium]
LENNLVYSNNLSAIQINASAANEQVINNTLYQPVGDGIRVLNGVTNLLLENNIIQVTAGFDVNVDPSSQSGFASDYNDLSLGNDPRAHVGQWGNVTRAQLSDWQTATSQDNHSTGADPNWVDINGADNVLGYSPANGGYDGGKDDNFYVNERSPAIDSGNSWYAPPTDIEGFARADDAGTANTGSPDYRESPAAGTFAASGVAQNWRSFQNSWNYTLPFAFPFYGNSYTKVIVSSSGFLQFAGNGWTGDPNNSTASLLGNTRIAPLWGNIRTDQTGNDIFVDTSVANQVTIRWAASNVSDNNSPVNFSVTLFADGHFVFSYGAGNANLTPTVGISSGNAAYQSGFLISANNGVSSLNNASSEQFILSPGSADIGAYEYRGTSTNTTPPAVTSTAPVGVSSSGTIPPVGTIIVSFSEAVNSIDAQAPAAYELRGAGADGQLDTADDVRYILQPTYVGGSTSVSLVIVGAVTNGGVPAPWTGTLPTGFYRLTVYSLPSGGIHDISGLELDGDSNGTPGGNYVRTFTVVPQPPPSIVTSIVGDGTAQRSEVRSYTVSFSEAVILGPGAFTLALLNTAGSGSGTNDGSAPTDESAGLSWTSADGGKTWIITFSANTDLTHSLLDGIYSLTVHAAKVTDAASGLVPMAADSNFTFHRLFGDINGDKTVNLIDYRAFKKAYLSISTSANWNPLFDTNGDGTINLTDYRAFKRNYLKQFTY